MSNDPSPLTYRDAGVDIDAGNALVERIKPLARSTQREGVVASLGGFGALFELPLHRYRAPLLVSGTDGVGSKLRLAIDSARHDTVGIDLVAMCANDVLAQGAEPLFFLDYYATGALDIEVATSVVSGIAQGCREAGMALIGGETAEMPGMYQGADYDLAGFCVGIVERDRLVDPSGVAVGDRLLGLPSTGPHSNGYSLIRRVLERALSAGGAPEALRLGDRPLLDALLEPTRIYVRDLTEALDAGVLRGIAHITGGGLSENIARILPPGTGARLARHTWPRPPVFDWIQATGEIAEPEMQRTFNCGLGMVVAVAAEDCGAAIDALGRTGRPVYEVGEVIALDPSAPVVEIT